MSLSGKRVLITGGTGALGGVVAERFLREGMGVASTCRPGEESAVRQGDAGQSLLLIPADVTREGDVVGLFDRALEQLQRVDVLVNIVGGYAGGAKIHEIGIDEWDGMMQLNLRSAFLCSREYLRRRGQSGYGRIISVGAMPALRPAPGSAAYAVSKAGVIALTQMLGAELKGSGVTANAIAPGIIDTAANRASMPDGDRARWVPAADIAETMVYICSDRAASINGVCIPMFGGL
jgi:NAD(P)-dependent dehydrogenase (short-subunit alcohol dehydrogenase family)